VNDRNSIKIEDILKNEGIYTCQTSGLSMHPMLRDRRDTVIITRKNGRLKKYDVPLYKRGNEYVLHRVIKILPGGGYNIRGDNCYQTEKNIPEDAVIGVLSEFWRDEKHIDMNSLSYKLYCRLWVNLHPLIFFIKKSGLIIRQIIKHK